MKSLDLGRPVQYAEDLSWLDDYENIHTLASFLANEKGYSMDNILHFLEKPWHYTQEYKEWRKYMDWEMNEATEKVNGYSNYLERHEVL
tara:strand:- start:13187 stop:13453 length:267 start_codon:yes stop_codon:yes gene_type:complete